jgi:hypothetical protein
MGKNQVDLSVAQGELDIAHRFGLVKDGDPSRLERFHQEIDISSPLFIVDPRPATCDPRPATRDPRPEEEYAPDRPEPTLDRALYYGDFRFGQSHGLACFSRYETREFSRYLPETAPGLCHRTLPCFAM